MKKFIPAVLVFIFFAGVSVTFVHGQTQRITYQCSSTGDSYNTMDACENTCTSGSCVQISAPPPPANPPPANPSNPSINAGATIQNPFRTGGNLEQLFVAILNNVVMPIGAVAVVMGFIYTGFLFVQAQGSDKELPKARDSLKYTVIGAIILLGAGVIANVISNTINQLR